MHLPNGSYVTFGGNSAVGRGGASGSQVGPTGIPSWVAGYKDFDVSKSIRVLNLCTNSYNFADVSCQWYDGPSVLSMQKHRWYSTAEAFTDGSIVLMAVSLTAATSTGIALPPTLNPHTRAVLPSPHTSSTLPMAAHHI